MTWQPPSSGQAPFFSGRWTYGHKCAIIAAEHGGFPETEQPVFENGDIKGDKA